MAMSVGRITFSNLPSDSELLTALCCGEQCAGRYCRREDFIDQMHRVSDLLKRCSSDESLINVD